MNPKLQPARGTQDLLPETAAHFRALDKMAFSTAELFGFQEIHTPIFEFSDVFHRTLGETSDVVAKETYTFTDRGGESLTLRPEGTAGIARALISNGLQQHLPMKLYYSGPMFRYERPQKGRYRQFHQLGVEMLGFDSPDSDVECIALGYEILRQIGLLDKVTLEINTLGDAESRQKHREVLVTYLQDFKDQLSEDSKVRLVKNPLRILDSKDEGDRKIIAGAPALENCLNLASQEFFAKVKSGLELLKIPFQQSKTLVRGLDYYTHTVFEFTSSHLGAQSAVLAGGRYDGLIEQMGGPKTPSVGWASGIERLALLFAENYQAPKKNIVAVLSAEEMAETKAFSLTQDLRKNKIAAEIIRGGNMGKKFKKADKIGASHVIIIGSQEINSGTLMLKDLKTGQQSAMTEVEVFQLLKV